MTDPVKDRLAMIAGMAPALDPETYVFVTTRDAERGRAAASRALALFHEEEGLSLILPLAVAQDLAFPVDLLMSRITLTVNSALDGVGLTAAVATALAEAGISCNMVAAYHHDHVFVPADLAERALDILRSRASDPS